jgi:hypothetical protein
MVKMDFREIDYEFVHRLPLVNTPLSLGFDTSVLLAELKK